MLQQLKKLNPSIVRYAVAGVLMNLVGYAIYVLVTYFGVEHKIAMSCLYFIGIGVNFYVNRRWTFKATGSSLSGFGRYVIVIILGYLLNLVWLYIFADYMGFAHQVVQALAIVLMAGYFFAANKFIVHTHKSTAGDL